MKKVFALMAIAGMFAYASCGPKAEEATTEGTENTENMEATATVEEAATEATVDESAAMATDSTATEAAPAEGATEAVESVIIPGSQRRKPFRLSEGFIFL